MNVHQRFTLLMHMPGLTLQSHQVQSSAQSSMHTCTVCGQTFKLPTAGCILRSGQSLAHTHAACTIARQAQADRQAGRQAGRQADGQTEHQGDSNGCDLHGLLEHDVTEDELHEILGRTL